MKLLLSLFLILSGFTLRAQNDTAQMHKMDTVNLKPGIESEFPGGLNAWVHYLVTNLKYPEDAHLQHIQGTVIVKFIVEVDGKVTDVQAVSGPMELREAAVSLIKHSPKWIPAMLNGTKVKSYKTQPINYRMDQ
jgi:periplasmic protein TonB